MVRPKLPRRVKQLTGRFYFKPAGIPKSQLENVELSLEEAEAVRLMDLEGLYQEEAAKQMNVSRQTLGRILVSARKKIADALFNLKALELQENEQIAEAGLRHFECGECGNKWELSSSQSQPKECSSCSSDNIYRFAGECRQGSEARRCRRRGK